MVGVKRFIIDCIIAWFVLRIYFKNRILFDVDLAVINTHLGLVITTLATTVICLETGRGNDPLFPADFFEINVH